MTMMDGDDLQRLWSLIEDLTNQLQANRQLCESLQQQADQLRGQAIHSGTGFALRRFNTDLSKEKFESELEALNVHLVKENLTISHENKQQAMLLREYENTLETIMAKFRSFSHSTQQHTLRLTQHYESLLANTTHNAAEQTLAAETAFSGTLSHLGGLVRKAMKSLDGEDSSSDGEAEDMEGKNDGTPISQAKTKKNQHGWSQDPRWFGSGGYTGKSTDPASLRAEAALEHLTEEERLRIENETLRELLQLKEKSDAVASLGNLLGSSVPTAAEGSNGASIKAPLSSAERRASLTVDEAAIAKEASGQPSLKALDISSTLRPREDGVGAASPRSSPKTSPVLDRKEQIIEEAILAEDTDCSGRGRRNSEGKVEAPSDLTRTMESIPLSSSGTATTSSVHAVAQDADEIAGVDPAGSAGEALMDGPNLVAEAAPPALVSTGIEDTDQSSSNTSVSAASGADPHEISESAGPVSLKSSTTAAEPTSSDAAVAKSSEGTAKATSSSTTDPTLSAASTSKDDILVDTSSKALKNLEKEKNVASLHTSDSQKGSDVTASTLGEASKSAKTSNEVGSADKLDSSTSASSEPNPEKAVET